jgi:hypothetical protein
MGKKSRSGSGSWMNIPDHISESLETNFWVKNADPGSGMEKFGSGIIIPDQQHWVPKH